MMLWLWQASQLKIISRDASTSSWPGVAVRRTASLPLAYVPAVHVSFVSRRIVDARDPGTTEKTATDHVWEGTSARRTVRGITPCPGIGPCPPSHPRL